MARHPTPPANLPALAADPVAQRLDEERWTPPQGRIEAGLYLGQHAEAAAELRTLTRVLPPREPHKARDTLARARATVSAAASAP